MKPRSMKLGMAVALIAGTGLFAQAEESGGEELLAFADRPTWLGPDEIDETFGNRAFWLAPDEFAEAFDEKTFALLASLLPELPENPTDEQIRAAIETVNPIDKARILALIHGNGTFSYQAFREWAGSIGLSKVAGSAHAGDSFAFGVESLFENEPKVEITSAAVGSNASGEAEMTVAVTVKDGDADKPVSSANVAAMFEATTDVADWTPTARLEPHVTDRTGAVATPVEFTVKPGDGKAPKAYLRLRK